MMYIINTFGFKPFAQPEFLPGFLGVFGLLIFSLFFFWLIGLPLKNKRKNHFNNYPLDVLNMEESKYFQEMSISNVPEKPLSRTNKYVLYGLSLMLCFIPMSELLEPLF